MATQDDALALAAPASPNLQTITDEKQDDYSNQDSSELPARSSSIPDTPFSFNLENMIGCPFMGSGSSDSGSSDSDSPHSDSSDSYTSDSD